MRRASSPATAAALSGSRRFLVTRVSAGGPQLSRKRRRNGAVPSPCGTACSGIDAWRSRVGACGRGLLSLGQRDYHQQHAARTQTGGRGGRREAQAQDQDSWRERWSRVMRTKQGKARQQELVKEIGLLGRKGRLQDLRCLVEQAESEIWVGASVEKGRGGFERGRLSGPEWNAYVYNAIISAYGRCGQWREAVAVLTKMTGSGVTPDIISYNSAIAACAKAGQHVLSLSLMKRAERGGLVPDVFTYNACINACARYGQQAQAESVFRAMQQQGVAPDAITFSSLMKVHNRAMDFDATLSLLRSMNAEEAEPTGGRERGDQGSNAGAKADAHCYSAAMDACAGLGDPERAEPLSPQRMLRDKALLDEMRRVGLEPTVQCYNIAMKAFADEGNTGRTVQLLHDMLDADTAVRPDVVSYNTALLAHSVAVRMEMSASSWSGSLGETRQSVEVGGGEDAEGAQRVQRRDGCARLVGWMVAMLQSMEKGGTGRVRPNAVSYGTTMSACARAGDAVSALQLLDVIARHPEVDVDEKMYCAVISACAKAGRLTSALDLLQEMREGGRPPVRSQHVGRQQGQRTAQGKHGKPLRPNAHCYAAAISGCAATGDLEQALTLLQRMQDDGLQADTACYNAAITVCRVGRQWEEALRLFGRLEGSAFARPTWETFRQLLEVLDAAEKSELADSLYLELVALGYAEHQQEGGHSAALRREGDEQAFSPMVLSAGKGMKGGIGRTAQDDSCLSLRGHTVSMSKAALRHALRGLEQRWRGESGGEGEGEGRIGDLVIMTGGTWRKGEGKLGPAIAEYALQEYGLASKWILEEDEEGLSAPDMESDCGEHTASRGQEFRALVIREQCLQGLFERRRQV